MDNEHKRLVEATRVLAEALDDLADKYGRSQTARIVRATATKAWELYHVLRDVSQDTQ